MKGGTEDALKAKGLSFKVMGGAGAAEPVRRTKAKRAPLLAPRSRPVVDEIVVELDIPPSVNGCWANVEGVGRVRSKTYRQWHRGAAVEASLSRGRIEGNYSAVIELGEMARGSDADNRTKPTLDMLAGLLTDDDCACVDVRAVRSSEVPARRMRVTLRHVE